MSNISEKISSLFFGINGGLTKDELSVSRYKFSDLLPYIAYDEESHFYYLKDNSIGFVYECVPLIFAGDTMSKLASIFKISMPEGSVIQTVLYADPYVDDILNEYKNIRYSNPLLNSIYKNQVESFAEYFKQGAADGLWQLSGTPVRNYRLYISIKIPVVARLDKDSAGFRKELKRYKEFVNDIVQSIQTASLHPKSMAPEGLLTLLYRIFNRDSQPRAVRWNKDMPLNKQIINAETVIKRESSYIRFGDTYAKCLTPKQYPENIDSLFINNLIGYFGIGKESINDDVNQIRCPFLFTTSFIYENVGNYLDMRTTQINAQSVSGNLAKGVVLRRGEFDRIKHERESDGKVFLRVLTQMWLFGKDEDSVSDNINRVASIWTNCNCASQKEKSFIIPKLFVSALPLGLYGNDYKDLERDHIMSSEAAAHLMTIQAGCLGLGKPYMLYLDRRGQLVSLDMLNTGTSKNIVVTGGTGAGKSFMVNYIVNSYMSAGAKARIIDVGKSYEKMAMMFGGQFIEFAGSNIIINFFENIGDIENVEIPFGATEREAEELIKSKKDDYAATMAMLTGIIATMVMKTDDPASPMQITIIEMALREIYAKHKNNMNIDMIADYMRTMPNADEREKAMASEGFYLSGALQKYCSNGEYGHYFSGKSNVKFDNDLVVVELDGIPKDFRKVVVLSFAMMIESEIYNGDRKRTTLVQLDEAWQTLSENPAAAIFAEGLYRKIRKYNGSVGIVTQSIEDLAPGSKTLGHLGPTVMRQSHMHFILPDKALKETNKKDKISFSDFEWKYLVDNLTTNSVPRYSEFLVKTSDFSAAFRLVVDEFSYFVNSSDATDNVFLNYHRQKFMREDRQLNANDAMVMAIHEAMKTVKELGGMKAFKEYVASHFMKTEAS